MLISSPINLSSPKENVRPIAYEGEDYQFNMTTLNPGSIPVAIGFPLGHYFRDEELALVAKKDSSSHLTVDIAIDYWDGFDDQFNYFALTYRGKDTHGYDSWGMFPTESEKQYNKTNPPNR